MSKFKSFEEIAEENLLGREDGKYTIEELKPVVNLYAIASMISENESILEMARRHCDMRTIIVIEQRIADLNKMIS